MKILVISDYHFSFGLPDINPDVVFLLGDIDYLDVKKIDNYFDCPKFGVLGNHDGPDFLTGNVQDVHGNVIEFNGYKIAGFGGSPVYNKRKYCQYDEFEVEEFTQGLETVDFFIAHSNPQLQQNNDETDAHRGFRAFTDYIKKAQPTYFLHGHLHEEQDYKIDNTSVLSVYPFYVLEIE